MNYENDKKKSPRQNVYHNVCPVKIIRYPERKEDNLQGGGRKTGHALLTH